MPNLSIKDVPEAWAEALRQRAARNHRSLQGELMAIVEQAVGEQAGPDVVGFDRFGHPVVRQGWKSVEQVVADLRAKFPEPIDSGPLGVDIIRADRDAR
jgi:hypothetical protein